MGLPMNWNDLDDKLKRKHDKNYVSCDEDYELQTVRDFVKDEFNGFSDQDIKKAVQSCCKSTEAPHPRKEFLKCVVNLLNK